MSMGKSISTTLERTSGYVRQSRHIKKQGSGSALTTETLTVSNRRIGFSAPVNPREVGEALWTAKDIL